MIERTWIDERVKRLDGIALEKINKLKVGSDSYNAWYNVYCDCMPSKTMEEVKDGLKLYIQAGTSRVGHRITSTRKRIYQSVIDMEVKQ